MILKSKNQRAVKLTIFSFIFLSLNFCFQNCGGSFNANLADESELPITNEDKPKIMGTKFPSFQSLTDLNTWRERIWAGKCGPNKEWEVCFEGQSIAGDNQGPHLSWDNPIDDDWDEATTRAQSWRINLSDSESSDFMRIDRTIPGFQKYSGHFWRRDEFLIAENGFEAEFRIRVLLHSQDLGVMLHFVDDQHQFKIHFSPNSISFYKLIGFTQSNTPVAIQLHDNTSMTKFKVRKDPGSGQVNIWIEDVLVFNNQILMPGSSNTIYSPSIGERALISPRVGLGDNNNSYDSMMGGAFDTDYIRYRKAYQPSGRAGLRAPPSLPEAQNCTENLDWKTLRDDHAETIISKIQNLGSVLPDVSPSKFGRTFEFEVQLLNTSEKKLGFSFDYFDRLGGIILTLYPNHLEIKADTKPGLASYAEPTGFDGLSKHRIRLVRSNNGLYWNVYMDDNSIPYMVDVRSSGISPKYRGLLFGPFATKEILNLSQEETVITRSLTDSRAIVSSIRWIDRALGSNDCL